MPSKDGRSNRVQVAYQRQEGRTRSAEGKYQKRWKVILQLCKGKCNEAAYLKNHRWLLIFFWFFSYNVGSVSIREDDNLARQTLRQNSIWIGTVFGPPGPIFPLEFIDTNSYQVSTLFLQGVYPHCVVYSYTCAVTGFPLTMFLPTPSWYTPSAARTERVRGLIFFRPSATMHTTTYHGHEYKGLRTD